MPARDASLRSLLECFNTGMKSRMLARADTAQVLTPVVKYSLVDVMNELPFEGAGYQTMQPDKIDLARLQLEIGGRITAIGCAPCKLMPSIVLFVVNEACGTVQRG